ncbi:BTB domain-containing protein [Caenorhabditis elegans]|uniref:BTB domain-containing protein n=1 Tax=Caenorhabditis elegans TaxID=6239 RepID=D2N112_CAEEL|nr:BTB domain-containing protein [Caenorhabditis elegans]CBI83240.1 BTB domain-containing protein [Caenorhabditis elegans]|eukprot:NP_001254362.1 Uncharacterized protein CELE_F18A11.5 [Caenorhabditis elegans]
MEKSQNSMTFSQEGGSNLSERVLLNVGGKKFETTVATLTRVSDTVLAVMVSDRWKTGDEIFIDRDPKHFGKVLNYLRDGDHFVAPSDTEACDELKREAHFYNMPFLAEMCMPMNVDVADVVQWKRDAIEIYWRPFVRYMVDDSLSLPFIYDRNNHTLARCIACEEFQDPKCSYLFDINYTAWEPMRHHMYNMTGEVTQLMGENCCIVAWDNGQQIHLPKSALSKVPGMLHQ